MTPVSERHGSGPVILMIHGLGGTANTWYAQRRTLERDFTVVCPDLAGSGRSPAPGPLSIDGFVADMLALLETMPAGPVHLVGHSMGTIICQHLAAQYPDRITSLALLGPLAEPPDASRKALRARAELARTEGMVPIAEALLSASLSAETRAARPVVCAMVREILMRQPGEGYARTCEALAEAKSADLAAIRCPTLLITGDEDGVGPPGQCREMARKMANARLVVLTATGHWTPIERPAEVSQALLQHYFAL